MSFTNRTQSQK